MTRSKILGLAIGASLLLGYEPVVEAAPVSVPSSATLSSSDGMVVKTVTAAGAAHRSARRTARRVNRRR